MWNGLRLGFHTMMGRIGGFGHRRLLDFVAAAVAVVVEVDSRTLLGRACSGLWHGVYLVEVGLGRLGGGRKMV